MGADGGWHMGEKHKSLHHDRLFYAFLNLEPVAPEVFMVPCAVVQDAVRVSQRPGLSRQARVGACARTPRSGGSARPTGSLCLGSPPRGSRCTANVGTTSKSTRIDREPLVAAALACRSRPQRPRGCLARGRSLSPFDTGTGARRVGARTGDSRLGEGRPPGPTGPRSRRLRDGRGDRARRTGRGHPHRTAATGRLVP